MTLVAEFARAGSLGLLALAACGCSRPEQSASLVHHVQGKAFGTTWNVKWVEPAPATEHEVTAAVTEALATVDAAMSTWRDDSELSRARAYGGPMQVSEETALVVREALALAKDTGGAFDPTVQPLMELWGFHGASRQTLPTDSEIEAARAQVDWTRVTLGRTLEGPTLDVGGTALDLSAIAKGHGVDRAAQALSDLLIADYMVEIGGEVRVSGRSASGGPWVLGIDLPEQGLAPGSVLAGALKLNTGALATSGNYRNRFEIGGVAVHHTMDPRTGRPASSRVSSVSVLAPDCRTADGVATALMVLDPMQGLAWVDARPDLEALWLLPEGDGFKTQQSAGLSRHLVAAEPDASGHVAQ